MDWVLRVDYVMILKHGSIIKTQLLSKWFKSPSLDLRIKFVFIIKILFRVFVSCMQAFDKVYYCSQTGLNFITGLSFS